MKRFDLKETIRRLSELELESQRKEYFGDATEYAFRRHVLILLNGLKRKPRTMSKYNLHVSKEMKAGKTMEEAVKTWRKK